MLALIVGTGSIGQRHILNLRRCQPDLRLLIYRRDGRLDALAHQLQATVLNRIEDCIERQPDFAVIAQPSGCRAEALLPLIAANVALYIEKPLVTSREDLESVRGALVSSSYSGPSMMGCNLRWLPSLQALRQRLVEGLLGPPVRASFQAGQWLPDWRPGEDYRQGYSARKALGGGVVMDLIHELDAARWLLGEFDSVHAVLGKLSSLEIETEDTAGIAMATVGGDCIVTVGLDYVARSPVRHYEIIGEHGTLQWDLRAQRLDLLAEQGRQSVACGSDAFNVAATYEVAMRQWVAAVERSEPVDQDIAEGLASAELAIRVKENATWLR